MSDNCITVRERTTFRLPSQNIEVDFGQGRVLVTRCRHYEGCEVVASEDSDIPVGRWLPVAKDGDDELVVMPGITGPEGFVVPEGFKAHMGTSNRDKPWTITSRALEWAGPENRFVFYLSDEGLDSAPKLPIQAIFETIVEDPSEDDPNFVWFVVDSDKRCWRGSGNHRNGTVFLNPVRSYEEDDLPTDVLTACGLEIPKPQWQVEAEEAGWAPPVGSSGESKE